MIGYRCVVAVLTCHDNSKRLPGKVFAPFAGINLFSHTVGKLLACEYIDAIVVDTPHPEVCMEYVYHPRVVYHQRAANLCGDTIPVLDVLKGCRTLDAVHDDSYVVWVDFTKPLTPLETINLVIETAAAGNYDSVFTVKPLRGNLMGSAAVCSQLKPAEERKYLYWGAVRIRTKAALDNATSGTWGEGKRHVDLPIIQDWEVDIDYPHDLVTARAIYDFQKRGTV